MAWRGQGDEERREPRLGRSDETGGESPFDIRLDARDRAGGGDAEAPKGRRARAATRTEPQAQDADMGRAPRAVRREPEPEGRTKSEAAKIPKAKAATERDERSAQGRTKGGAAARETAPRHRRKRRSLLGFLIKWTLVLCVWAVLGVAGIVAYEAAKLPPMQTLMVPKRPPTIMIQAADGKPLATRGDMGGAAVPLKQLPPYLPNAFIAIEDRRFYEHWGLDPVGLGRAVATNLISRRVRQGGSTLTQQLAKNLFLTQERTFSRKIQEVILALWLEQKFTKAEILDLYMNRVYFGSGAYGVEAAAQRYFGKSARNVTLSEAAMLAGIVNAPSRLAPTRNLKAAQDRAALVLASMREQGLISPDMQAMALSRPATVAPPSAPGSIGYVADWVVDQLDSYVGELSGDVTVRTTIDANMQAQGQAALSETLAKSGAKFGVGQGALVSLDTDGAVKALIGGRSYEESQYNRAVTARRQPGSAFKPFIYLTALERGLTPDTVREDAPIQLKGWRPENSTHDYRGPVTLQQALALSLNTVSVRLVLEVGPKAVVATAHRLGIASQLEPNASIALGTSEVSVLELASAYVPFANGGIGVIPYVIDTVKGADGRVLYARAASGPGRVMAPEYAGMMNRMLEETLITGTGRRADLPGWEAAGKTGTSQDYRDAWFVGYTARLVTAVWLGNDDSSPTKKASGANLPVEIWSRYMKGALQGVPVADLPGGARSPGFGIGQPFPPGALPDEAPPAVVGTLPPAQAPRQQEPMTLDRWFVDTFLGGRR